MSKLLQRALEKVQPSPQRTICLFEQHCVIIFATIRISLYKLFKVYVIIYIYLYNSSI